LEDALIGKSEAFHKMANWLFGILLGIVQGVSEWLPISSKTQVIFVSGLILGLPFQQGYALGLFLEAGTFIAATFYFRREVWGILLALVGRGNDESRLLLRYLVVVTILTGVVGVIIYRTVSDSSVNGPVLGFPMIALGLVLIGDGILIALAKGRTIPSKGLKDLTLRDLIIIGIVQGVAAFPGVSRSGVTVSAMLLLGINPKDSFRLSFLALIPASLGAAGVTVLLTGQDVSSVVSSLGVDTILLAIAVALAFGLIFIRLLLRAAGSNKIAALTLSLGILAIVSGLSSLLVGHG
jgi:undecaprenyl-diphosphatase